MNHRHPSPSVGIHRYTHGQQGAKHAEGGRTDVSGRRAAGVSRHVGVYTCARRGNDSGCFVFAQQERA